MEQVFCLFTIHQIPPPLCYAPGVHEEYAEDHYIVTHDVGPGDHGARLDRFLKDRLRKRSRAAIQESIDRGVITIQREPGHHFQLGKIKASQQLLTGDQVLVLSARKPEPPVDFNYQILHEDESLFIINKPGNLPVHPAGRYFFNSLLVHLRTHGHQTPLKANREYFLVHRIDRETSGVLVLTKTRVSAAHLTKQFADRVTDKYYLAVVHGAPQQEFEVAAPMRRSTTSRIELKMEIAPSDDAPNAQTALTRFKLLERAGPYSLLACYPKTGRQHQIRVHLNHVGHPIVGDKLYGMSESDAYRYFESKFLSDEAKERLLLPRHGLHAAGIRFKHPDTDLLMEYATPPPPDLRHFLYSKKSLEFDPMRTLQRKLATLGLVLLIAGGCAPATETGEDDIANTAGDVMASADEAATALSANAVRAQAFATCGFGAASWSSCAAGMRTRTFEDCSVGLGTWNGSVILTFSQAACTMSSANDTVTRAPNFTITGRRSRTLTLSTGTGGVFQGQRLTRGATAGTFSYEVSKIKRVATDATGATTLDLESNTSTGITLTGLARANRTMDGGTLEITDALNTQTYTLTPEAVTWDGTCTCASSGRWIGSVSTTGSTADTTTVTVKITACGSADVTLGDTTTSVELDRCLAL